MIFGLRIGAASSRSCAEPSHCPHLTEKNTHTLKLALIISLAILAAVSVLADGKAAAAAYFANLESAGISAGNAFT